MRNPIYLELSEYNIYHFRWPVPQPFWPDNKRRYIKISLETRHPKEALHLAKGLVYVAERLAQNRALQNMDYLELKQIVQTYFQRCLQQEKQRLAELGPLDKANSGQVAGSKLVSDSIDLVKRLTSYHEVGDHKKIAEQICHTMELDIWPHQPEWKNLEHIIANAFPAYAQAYKSMSDKLITDFDLLGNEGTELISSVAPNQSPTKYQLGQVIRIYIATHVSDGAWDYNTEQDKTAILTLLEELLGTDYNIANIDLTKAREIRDTLKLIPKNRNKNPLVRDMSIKQAVMVDNAEKISSLTFSKYLNTCRSLFEWCKAEGYVTENYFARIKGSLDKKKTEAPREAFTPEQSRQILQAIASNRDGKHYRYWGPLIGMFTGARLNEVAQLTLEDIQQKDGIWYFHMNDLGEDKRLKTNAAKRFVPIHQKLLQLGILQEVERLRSLGHKRFLHELTYCKKNGYGKKLGHYFNQVLLVDLGIKKKELVFHSLRHTAITRLYQAGVQQPIIETIVGHERSGTSQQVYFREGYKLAQLKEALDKYDPLDC